MSLADERKQRSRLSLFMAHILKQAMQDGISWIEAQQIWEACAEEESSLLLPGTWAQYQPEIIR